MEAFDIAIVEPGWPAIWPRCTCRFGQARGALWPRRRSQDGRTTALMAQSMDFIRDLGLCERDRRRPSPAGTMRILDGTAPAASRAAGQLPVQRGRPGRLRLQHPECPLPAQSWSADLPASGDHPLPQATLERLAVPETPVDLAPVRRAFDRGRAGGRRRWPAVRGARRRRRFRCAPGPIRRPRVVLNFAHDPAACEHLDRVPYRARAVHPGAAAGPPLEPRLGAVAGGGGSHARLPLERSAARVEERMQSMLGKVTVEAAPQVSRCPACRRSASARARGAARRGRARLPADRRPRPQPQPARCDGAASTCWANPPARPPRSASAFDRRRRADIQSRTASVDLLNRSLLSASCRSRSLRTPGCTCSAAIGPLRSVVMREGVAARRLRGSAVREYLREQVRRQAA